MVFFGGLKILQKKQEPEFFLKKEEEEENKMQATARGSPRILSKVLICFRTDVSEENYSTHVSERTEFSVDAFRAKTANRTGALCVVFGVDIGTWKGKGIELFSLFILEQVSCCRTCAMQVKHAFMKIKMKACVYEDQL